MWVIINKLIENLIYLGHQLIIVKVTERTCFLMAQLTVRPSWTAKKNSLKTQFKRLLHNKIYFLQSSWIMLVAVSICIYITRTNHSILILSQCILSKLLKCVRSKMTTHLHRVWPAVLQIFLIFCPCLVQHFVTFQNCLNEILASSYWKQFLKFSVL